MKITDGEKLILYLLCDIKDKLDITTELDTDFIKNAIGYNHLWGIEWKYPGIPFEESELPNEVKDVLNILEMWSIIEFSVKNLSETEKQKIEVSAIPFGKDPKFRGFDGNNESEYLSIASFLINDLDRFVEFKGRYLNSHMPVLASYFRMLKIYENYKQINSLFQKLPTETLIEILKAQIHPSNRD